MLFFISTNGSQLLSYLFSFDAKKHVNSDKNCIVKIICFKGSTPK